jgi:hypothetical protein
VQLKRLLEISVTSVSGTLRELKERRRKRSKISDG